MEFLTIEELEARKAEVKDYFWFCWNFRDPEGWTNSDFGLGIANAAAQTTNKFVRLAAQESGEIPDEEVVMDLFKTVFVGYLSDLEIIGEDEESKKVVITMITGQRPE